MIKNAREYQITKAQAARFERALEEKPEQGVDAAMRALEHDALRSQLAELRADLDEYDALESGRLKVLEVDNLEDLPQALIRARIASRLSQRELAERLGLKEQQIQRYEATEYASASLSRILEVVRALGLKLRQDVALPSLDVSHDAVVDRLRGFGFEKTFVETRLIVDDDTVGWRCANAAARVFGMHPARLFSETPKLRYAAASASFKLPANASASKLFAYTSYARYLAEQTLAASPVLGRMDLPSRPGDFHETLMSQYGGISFESAVRYIWDLGIAVLPLCDAGAFHGAFWKIGGRNVIVLKQRVQYQARWLIDLLHEYYHAVQAQGVDDSEVLELAESPFERQESEQERTATAWANAAAMAEREEELAQMCVDAAGGEERNLKNAVIRIARQEHVPSDVLANYLAHKLERHHQSKWWATAASLQQTDVSPWAVARDVFLERTELHRLDGLDRELIVRALSEREGS